MLDKDRIRQNIIQNFPKLATDQFFKITGKPSPNYNCIAWAALRSDVWWWPMPENIRPKYVQNGVIWTWPIDDPHDTQLETFCKVFQELGYEKCEHGEYEENFRKIALYTLNDEVTHAARQLTNGNDLGKWTSKLGPGPHITHGDAKSIESNEYGVVTQYMRKSML